MVRFAVLPVLLCLLAFAGPVNAQDSWSVIPNDYVMNDLLNRQRIEAAIGRPPGTPPKGNAMAPKTVATASTRYAASPEVSRRVQAQFVSQLGKAVGADQAALLAGALSSGDPVVSWSGIVGGDGLRAGDMADAFASYWIMNWVMANGADNTRTQALAVRDQVRPVMAGYGGLGEAQKQEMAETFMLNFLLQQAAYVDAMKRGDRTAMTQLGDAAVARFKREMGVDLRALKLTDNGFVVLAN